MFLRQETPVEAIPAAPVVDEGQQIVDAVAEELAQQVRDVTPERIFRAMQTVKLDTVYFLQGKEAAE